MARHLAPTGTPRRRRLLLGTAAAGVLTLIALPIGATWAAFTDGAGASTSQSGKIDIAQDSAGTSQYGDRSKPNVVTPTDKTLIAYLRSAPSGSPSVATASFPVSVYLLTPYRSVALRATLYDTGSSTAFPWLLFDIQADGASVLPGGTPLSAADILALNDGTGAALPVPAEGSPAAVTVRVWLAPGSPPAAFRSAVTPGIAISAETVGGQTFIVKEKLG